MLGTQSNPLLAQAESAIQSKVSPELRPMVQRIVAAGQKVMYDPKTHSMMLKALSAPGDKAAIAGQCATKLLGLLYTEAHGGIKVQAAIPAGVVLLCEGLDFMEKSGMIKVTQQVLADAMQSMMTSTLQMFGISPQKLTQMKQAKAGSAPAGQPAPPSAPAQPPSGGIIAGAQGAM